MNVQGVLHAIERQQQRRAHRLQCREELILTPGRERGDLGRNALMRHIAELLTERVRVDALHRTLVAAGQLFDRAGARVVALLGENHGEDAIRLPLEHDAHRVHAIDRLAGPAHARRRQGSSASARSAACARSIASFVLTHMRLTMTR